MPMLTITPLYTSVIIALALLLSLRIIRHRRGQRISLGTEGDDRLLRSVRAHANLTEHVPLALLLMGFLELNGGAAGLLHAIGAALLLGRCVHAWSLISGWGAGRVAGMGLTFTSWLVLVPANLMAALW